LKTEKRVQNSFNIIKDTATVSISFDVFQGEPNMFKKFFLTGITLAILLLPAANSFAAEPILVSGNMYSAPVMWEKSKEIVGVGPKLIEKIFTELHIDYRLEDMGDWDEVQERARGGSIDVIVSAYQNNDRKTYLEFSESYFPQPVVLVIPKETQFKFNTWNDLIGKKGATHFGESFGQKLDTFMANHLDIKRAGMKRCFDLLDHAMVDYIIIDFFKGLNYIHMLRRTDSVQIVKQPLTVEYISIAIAKSSPLIKRLPEINARIKAMKKDGTLAAMVKDANILFQNSMNAREKMFRRARRDGAAAQGIDPRDRPDFHQMYREALGNATYLAY
jgi:polar amino acid transport system substrate-binding protein